MDFNDNPMFRFLEKYTGKYRVLPHLDYDTGDFPRDEEGNIDESYDDLYIPCKGGIEIRHSYEPNKLAFILLEKSPSMVDKIINKVHEKGPEVKFEVDRAGKDAFIYFDAKDIDKVAPVLGARTGGARIKWNAKSNIKKGKKVK